MACALQLGQARIAARPREAGFAHGRAVCSGDPMVQRNRIGSASRSLRAMRVCGAVGVLAVAWMSGCASTTESRQPMTGPPPRESAAVVFALPSSIPHELDASWMASRNDLDLAPGYSEGQSPTTVWPGPLRPYEERVPVIYSRWGREF